MPELPEVEIARRNLADWLEGKRIRAVRLPRTRVLRGTTPAALGKLLTGRTVRSVDRRGKWLELALSGGAALFSHLGMTGKWVRRAPDAPAHKSERARLELPGFDVRYHDPRMFGRLVGSPDGAPIEEWRALGPDPLADGLDPRDFAARLAHTHRAIKEALMDQSLIAGIGNIQAAEALWRARLHPSVRADALDGKQVRALLRAIDDSIAATLASETAPEITYVEERGAENPFSVYGKAGLPCPRCGTPIARTEQGGRGTFFCPHCQPR